MKTITKNDFIESKFDSKNNMIIDLWQEETDNMTDLDYRNVALRQIENIHVNKPKYWLVDTSELKFTLAPKTQEWADSLFPKILEAGVRYIAFVISPDIFTQVSVEQLMDEKHIKTSNFEIKYFNIYEDALNWLIEN